MVTAAAILPRNAFIIRLGQSEVSALLADCQLELPSAVVACSQRRRVNLVPCHLRHESTTAVLSVGP